MRIMQLVSHLRPFSQFFSVMGLVSSSLFRFAAYGATKRSVVHLTKSLQACTQFADLKNIYICI